MCLYRIPWAYEYCDNDTDKRLRCSALDVFCSSWRKRRESQATSSISPKSGNCFTVGDLARNFLSFHSIAQDLLGCPANRQKPLSFLFHRLPAFCIASFYTSLFSSMDHPSTRLWYLAFCECPHASIRIVILRLYLLFIPVLIHALSLLIE